MEKGTINVHEETWNKIKYIIKVENNDSDNYDDKVM